MKTLQSNLFYVLAALSYLAAPVNGGFKILCDSLMRERIDPIISPGNVSAHVHLMTGANSINFSTSSVTTSTLLKSNCTSCIVKEDKSLYWVPQLYYQAQNGSFTAVPLDGDYSGQRGGIDIYYQNRAPGGTQYYNYTAFPPGFRMIAGNPFKRNFTNDFAGLAVSFLCLGVNGTSASQSYYSLPNVTCSQGVRAQLNFPQCWDGSTLDPPDHMSHMSYPINGTVNGTVGGPDGGACPSSHPVYMMQLFYEVVFRTDQFQWWSNTQPFVFAQGDPTGYGYHGDFISGWNQTILQKAANDCNMGPSGSTGDASACSEFTIATFDEQLACETAPQVAEDVIGPMSLLPGCNAVQSGPASATVPSTCTRTGSVGPAKTYYADQSKTYGYGYIGCGNDTTSNRTFSNYYTPPGMTVEMCVSYCNQASWTYAALEYQSTCYCGNSTYSDRLPQPGILGNCDMTCTGNSSEYCGGANALSFYQRCAKNGTSCKNTPSA